MTKFEIGTVYSMRSACDQDCVWSYKVIGRTAQTITIEDTLTKEVKKRRISKKVSEWNNAETIYPLGRYSMCPSLGADRKAA